MIRSRIFVLTFFIASIYFIPFSAGQDYTEGILTYKIELDASEDQLGEYDVMIRSLVKFFEMKVFFNPETVRTDIRIGQDMYEVKNFYDRNTRLNTVYTDVFGRRMKTAPSLIPKANPNNESSDEYWLEEINQTKELAGILGYKVKFTLDDTPPMEMYVTDAFSFDFNGFGIDAIAQIVKVPIEYEIKYEETRLRVYLSDFTPITKSSFFKQPAGYELVDSEDMIQGLASPLLKMGKGSN